MIRLPYASAKFGKRAPNLRGWLMLAHGQPLAGGRSLLEMARAMFTRMGLA